MGKLWQGGGLRTVTLFNFGSFMPRQCWGGGWTGGDLGSLSGLTKKKALKGSSGPMVVICGSLGQKGTRRRTEYCECIPGSSTKEKNGFVNCMNSLILKPGGESVTETGAYRGRADRTGVTGSRPPRPGAGL